MSRDTVVRARIGRETKARDTETLQRPNSTTVKAMKELDEGKGKRFGSAEELFQDLGI